MKKLSKKQKIVILSVGVVLLILLLGSSRMQVQEVDNQPKKVNAFYPTEKKPSIDK